MLKASKGIPTCTLEKTNHSAVSSGSTLFAQACLSEYLRYIWYKTMCNSDLVGSNPPRDETTFRPLVRLAHTQRALG